MSIVYRPLEQKREEIRLLDLEAANELDDPLCGTLRHVELKGAHFSALSYVWGDPDNDRSNIVIKYERSAREYLASKLPGKSRQTYVHSIGSSLARALRHLRQKYGRITIWTDALCINQDPLDVRKEKDWQVPLMKSIYSQAKEVHAWLGPRYDEEAGSVRSINAAFDVADKTWALSERLMGSPDRLPEESWLEVCFYLASTQRLSNQTQPAWTEFSIALRQATMSDRSLHSELSSMRTLSQNAYFSRMWILQEMGRARTSTFHFGPKHTSHRRIFLALSLANSLRDTHTNPQNGPISRFDHRFLGCLTARTMCMQKRSLLDVLGGAYFNDPPLHQASNPRDIIYARLGLAEMSGGIRVEYALSVADVYTDASRFLLSEGFLEILVTFRPYNFRKSVMDEGFPSWAYDWSKKGSNKFAKYTASGSTSQRVAIASYPHAKYKHALIMSGTSIGNVRATMERFSATVLASGLHERTVKVGNLRAVSEEYSPEKKKIIVETIAHAYLQLGIHISNMDIETLFEPRSLPLASFWSWWVHWIASLVSLIDDAEAQEPGVRSTSINLAELLFREGPGALNSTSNFKRFGTKAGMLALVDYQRWTTLLGRESDRYGPDDSTISQFAESLFRSAWGMRPAILHGGLLGYVPEDTRPQDDVVIFFGVKAPLVIRKVARDAYSIIGPAHICGAMQGELIHAALSSSEYKII
ncbi:hypothetical protein P171DRAFT_477236 [Karstenula rhodostoma CBS 690.94]|uniref:Heterokaryon incompatibility domain-containing protein n=1 Tax=Karstenula rhodostoma CBS 690.94 TaxID=1392251 RepID=A0A9P4P899_9PLEO|nr:hypothetical protein P171DRAFT_477236 [Karstenula rhodostoma CBS 690.94]